MKEQEIFSTRDIMVATTLVTHRFQLVGIDMQIEGNRPQPVGYFKFSNSKELQDARAKLAAGDLLVDPKMFMMNLHSLKAEVTNLYKNPNLS